jgi:REP element-mobilizing transposase RayT
VTHFKQLRRENRQQKPFEIVAMVVIPDHLRMVMGG